MKNKYSSVMRREPLNIWAIETTRRQHDLLYIAKNSHYIHVFEKIGHEAYFGSNFK
jgi:hypothetical protein